MESSRQRHDTKLPPRIDTPLRRWRLSKGLTQAAVAQEIGVTHAAFSKYENGQRIPYRLLHKLMEKTGLKYEALLRPKEYLEAHPHVFPRGIQPLPETGGRPRKFAQAL